MLSQTGTKASRKPPLTHRKTTPFLHRPPSYRSFGKIVNLPPNQPNSRRNTHLHPTLRIVGLPQIPNQHVARISIVPAQSNTNRCLANTNRCLAPFEPPFSNYGWHLSKLFPRLLELPKAPGRHYPTQTSKSISIGGWHLLWMLSDHPNYSKPRESSSQPKPPSRCQSVGGTYCDRWVAPIVDAIRPPKPLKAPGRQ
jgi:hypothetical protein